MATKKDRGNGGNGGLAVGVSSSVEELLLAALERGGDSFETGRYLVTFKEGAVEDALLSLGVQGQGMRISDARDFTDQAVIFEDLGDADALALPEIGVAIVGGPAAQERSMSVFEEIPADSPIEAIEPEQFVFAEALATGFGAALAPEAAPAAAEEAPGEYFHKAARILEAIAKEIDGNHQPLLETEEEALVFGATWGLNVCRVPLSPRSGAGIRIAVLDTGMDLGHPDFAGRPIVNRTFVGQPVQDLHGHGTHCIGTACGPKAPPGLTPRYGIGYQTQIFAGKVLSNSGSSVGGSVLAGMNWAVANRCQVISMSLGGPGGPFVAYTAAGQAALNNGCLMIAAAGNTGPVGLTNAPANSPTIMSVAALDANLRPASFSSRGKIEIAAPGAGVFSSVPRPTRYGTKSGTSMAAPHVAGCAALWAQTSPNLRGMALWNRLLATARPLPFPPSQVGRGLVQAPLT